jgi:hypothetical protein
MKKPVAKQAREHASKMRFYMTTSADLLRECADKIESLQKHNKFLKMSDGRTFRADKIADYLCESQAELDLASAESAKYREALECIAAQDPVDPVDEPTRLGCVCAIAKSALRQGETDAD